ncbi:FAD-binding oxidoreductase [Rummeliibacillus sp. TYF-LIM-RU47]|uniref:FAD-binding oxidoreductase n=1 Tax=Rummeliibacillus sp. TYF-LIM-RU47 TaxID=2608406 RepID=UPI001CC25A2F|nr:FAD-binding oxidoreductase [Rummeliibacillus sp. TYF-LIM-RU47]
MRKITELLKKPWFLGSIVVLFVGAICWNIPIEKRKYGISQSGLVTDYTGLLPERVEKVVIAKNRNDLQRIVKKANKNGQKISIAGLQHSQGGHTYYKDGVVLDMRTLNRILEINKQEKKIRVEAGATWENVQEAILPYGLALKVTQSQSIFTIGGSLSVNAHGRDIRFGPLAETVKEMTLLTPKGEIKKITRDDPGEWMKYVFGGYGLFGVILDVTLELTEDDLYTIHTQKLKTSEYESYFNRLMNQSNTAMHYARVSVAPSSFLDEMYVIDYNYTGKQAQKTLLKKEQGVRLSKLALDLGRRGGTLEDLFWKSQKIYISSLDGKEITRNNAMRSESTFMEYTKPGRVEVLQEFFVPVQAYEDYINELKQVIPMNDKKEDFKVHNITVRYAANDNLTSLNYAKEDMFGLVVLIQHGLKEKEIENATSLIQKWTNLTLKYGGTYYLPYYRYQTKKQFRKSYPKWQKFADEKQKRDPNHVFQNLFYEHYVK